MYTRTGGIMSTPIPSKVFMNGNSQAVRIPQDLRLSTSKVEISRTPEGDLLIHPVPEKRGDLLLQALAGFDREFADLLTADRADQQGPQDREVL
jgi:antitoxin VapB